MQWLGVDVGGTFTDFVLYDQASGALSVEKVPSTPSDPSLAMLAGIERMRLALERVAKLAHGTTVATNTILERKGAASAVITTRGFRDVLEVGRGNRTVLYNIKATRPPPLVTRSAVFEATERTLYDGSISRAVDPGEIATIAEELKRRGVEERRSLLTLFADENPQVRYQAATNVYSVAPAEAKACLEAIAAAGLPNQSLSAGMTLSGLEEDPNCLDWI